MLCAIHRAVFLEQFYAYNSQKIQLVENSIQYVPVYSLYCVVYVNITFSRSKTAFCDRHSSRSDCTLSKLSGGSRKSLRAAGDT